MFLLNGLNERTFHLDNRIWWNSTYLMLMNFFFLGYYEVRVQFVNHTGNANITENDIAMAKVFCEFFHIFYDETCALSAVYTPTSHLAIHSITKIAQHLHDVNHFPIFHPCIKAMKEKYNNY